MISQRFSWRGWFDKAEDLTLEEKGLLQRDTILVGMVVAGGTEVTCGLLKKLDTLMLPEAKYTVFG